MAGLRTEPQYTHKVNDTNGVTKEYFVEGVSVNLVVGSVTVETSLGIKTPTSANQDCIGVAGETRADGKRCAVHATPGAVVTVVSDGTVAVGDRVTNDSNAKATPISLGGTAQLWYSHGIALEVNLNDTTNYPIRMKWEKMCIYG